MTATKTHYNDYRVVVLDIDGFSAVATFDGLHRGAIYGSLVQAHKISASVEGGSVIIEGRDRLNDYVGSPVWSKWTEIDPATI